MPSLRVACVGMTSAMPISSATRATWPVPARVDHELQAAVAILERAHRAQQQLDDRGVDERALAQIDEQVAAGGGDAERLGDRVAAGDIVLTAERDDGGAGRDDFDRHRAGWRTASVEEVACVVGAFRRVPLAIGVAQRSPRSGSRRPSS